MGAAWAVAMLVLLAVAAGARAAPDAVPDEVLVRFQPTADGSDRIRIRDQASASLESTLPVSGLELLKVSPGQTVEGAIAALEGSSEVAFAEPNFYRRAVASPNDPSFSRLWGLNNTGQTGGTPDADIDAPEAWNLAIGSRSVAVGVVDSGLGSHVDLQPNLWANRGESGSGKETNRRDDDRNGYVDDVRGWDWVEGDNAPTDANGHGTHVAGTIAANGNDGRGIPGVGWRGNLMSLRVLDARGSGSVSNVILAYRYAAASGAKVVNASIGGSSFSQSERAAIASSPGTLFVVAAGNGGADGVGDNDDLAPEYPCAYDADNLVCVAATDRNDALAAFSNYGVTAVDLAAPGVSIYSTLPGGTFGYYSGTSMATPHVSGAAALVWARKPSATTTEAKAALLAGTDTKASLAGKVLTAGRLNMQRTLLVAAPTSGSQGDPSPPPQPQPAPSRPRPSRPAQRDRTPPRASVAVTSAAVRSGRVLVSVSCNEGCRFRLQLVLDRRTAKRLRLAKRRSVVVGRASGRMTRASRQRVVIRLVARARKKLARARRVRATLTSRVTDASGNATSVKRRVTLRR